MQRVINKLKCCISPNEQVVSNNLYSFSLFGCGDLGNVQKLSVAAV